MGFSKKIAESPPCLRADDLEARRQVLMMAENVFKNCELIDPDKVRATGCFTSLPVWQHKREDIANAASLALIRDSGEFLQDGREKTSHCSMSALGNLCTFVYPETDPERLGLLTYMTDLGLMHDGEFFQKFEPPLTNMQSETPARK